MKNLIVLLVLVASCEVHHLGIGRRGSSRIPDPPDPPPTAMTAPVLTIVSPGFPADRR